jgi:hypothetical protein
VVAAAGGTAFAETTEVDVCANESVAAAKTSMARDRFFTRLLDLREIRTDESS